LPPVSVVQLNFFLDDDFNKLRVDLINPNVQCCTIYATININSEGDRLKKKKKAGFFRADGAEDKQDGKEISFLTPCQAA